MIEHIYHIVWMYFAGLNILSSKFDDIHEKNGVPLSNENKISAKSRSGNHEYDKVLSNENKICTESCLLQQNNKTNTNPSFLLTKKKIRCFELIDIKTSKLYGKCTGYTPKQAAYKAFTRILLGFNKKNKIPPAQIIIYLRETTNHNFKIIYKCKSSYKNI